MTEDKMPRADQALCARGLAPSRERAQALIEAGLAFVDGQVIKKSAQRVAEGALMDLRGEVCPYVSRGGFKLEKALRAFDADVCGAVAIDVGASTGGFTDVLLRAGARRVYAVDVGSGQLDPRIAADPRVVNLEHTNARTLTRADFEEAPEIGVMDVSFISILKLLPALREILGERGRLIALVKPQFEAGRAALGKRGIVTNPAVHERVLTDVASAAPAAGWRVRALDFSPVRGGDGNLEFLADFAPDDGATPLPDAREIRALVRRAHAELKKS